MSTTTRVLVPLGTANDGGNYGHGELHFARQNYLEKLFEVELLPIMISPFTAVDDGLELLSECSGLLLMGGDDVDPRHYGAERHPKTNPVIAGRDELELALTKEALRLSIPLFGICRGAQVMAVATGGTLHQRIAELSRNVSHAAEECVCYHDWVSACEHDIVVRSGTRSAAILGNPTGPLTINSAHNQGIAQLCEPFVSVAHSSDGVIEIIEHRNADVFAIGVQCHPEVPKNGVLKPFFSAFARACSAMI